MLILLLDMLEVINSLGSVMANGSVHYKYLNPNLVAVVTESRDANKRKFFSVAAVSFLVFSLLAANAA